MPSEAYRGHAWRPHDASMPINFRSKLHKALLQYYSSDPRAEHYVRELSRLLSFDATYLSRELKKLARAGVFVSFNRAHEKYYRLNTSHPLYNEFQKIVRHIVAKKATGGRR